jgi:hypothetical protein
MWVKKIVGGVTLNPLCQWAFFPTKMAAKIYFFKPPRTAFWPFSREMAIDYVRELEPDKFSARSNRKRSHVSMVDRHSIDLVGSPICLLENVSRNDICQFHILVVFLCQFFISHVIKCASLMLLPCLDWYRVWNWRGFVLFFRLIFFSLLLGEVKWIDA